MQLRGGVTAHCLTIRRTDGYINSIDNNPQHLSRGVEPSWIKIAAI